MTQAVETYLEEGCGRCALGGTPECKVHTWHRELVTLRRIVLECGLDETCKWGVPCYTFQGKNVLLVSAFKDNCTVSFFKGSLLQDEQGVLVFAGENSHIAKLIRFTSLEEVLQMEDLLKTYIFEAIEVEKAGLKATGAKPMDLPEELLQKFDEQPELQAAFEALTPGKQRGYVLHFTGAKQSATRTTRIEKYIPKILAGLGFHD